VLSEGLAVLPYSVAEIQKEAEVLKGTGTGSKKKTSRVIVVGRVGVAVGVGAVILAAAAYFTGLVGGHPKLAGEPASAKVETKAGPSDAVDLTEKQVASIKVEPVGEHLFSIEKGAVGNIDYNEDMAVQVFTNYQGRIIELFAKVGDDVKKGQTLFTIDSPDLLQAESTLIAADGVLQLTTRVLNRQKALFAAKAAAQKDVDQAISDQQTAEGALLAARNAVAVFGKTEAEIDRVVAQRKVDSTLIVLSPIDGRVTARVAAPGLFVQPGNQPAPFTVADLSTKWMFANVIESDIPNFHLGQPVRVKVTAYPDRVFKGKITTIGTTVDPNTHRTFVRSEILDPEHRLLAGMYANFVIQTGEPVRATAVPYAAVVREGDGTMTVFVTTDGLKFVKRIVEIGLRQDGYNQILKGLKPGERIAAEGAVFLSNILALRTSASD
jgi:cobalt-zinc-cadmium efflux system membrane fusion protein